MQLLPSSIDDFRGRTFGFQVHSTVIHVICRRYVQVLRRTIRLYGNAKKLLLLLLLLSGKNLINPGPLCCVCIKVGRKTALSITCSKCENSYHRVCLNVSYHKFKTMIEQENWSCSTCAVTNDQGHDLDENLNKCSVCNQNRKRWILMTCNKCGIRVHRACIIPKLNPKLIEATTYMCSPCKTTKEKTTVASL